MKWFQCRYKLSSQLVKAKKSSFSDIMIATPTTSKTLNRYKCNKFQVKRVKNAKLSMRLQQK